MDIASALTEESSFTEAAAALYREWLNTCERQLTALINDRAPYVRIKALLVEISRGRQRDADTYELDKKQKSRA